MPAPRRGTGALEMKPAPARRHLTPFPFRPPKFRHIPIWTIVPDTSYSEALEFDPVKIEQAFMAGREAARSPFSEGELRQRLAA